jgi:hypothetical protein
VFVSAGPIVYFTLGKDKSMAGDSLPAPGPSVDAHLEVHAAPWVDVRSIDILVDGAVIAHRDLAKLETHAGKEAGTLQEVQQRSVRHREDFSLKLPADAQAQAHWALAIVRGEESLDRYLPATHIRPFAFTNPIWIGSRR